MQLKTVLLAAAVALLPAGICRADNFSFTGNFSSINEVQEFTFTVGSGSDVVLRTYSYAGGTNAAGQVIAEGGFDPILALFQGTGPSAVKIGQNDDGGGSVPADPVTGTHYDTYLEVSGLTPGTYTATIQDYANFAIGPTLGDGFTNGALTGGTYIDATGTNRDNHWAFDVLGVESASNPTGNSPSPVPEPSSLLLLGSGFVGFAGALRRRLTT